MTFNAGAVPVAVLMAVLEWRGRYWINDKAAAATGRTTTQRQRHTAARMLQVRAVIHVALAVVVITYDFG